MHVYDLTSGTFLQTLPLPTGYVYDVIFMTRSIVSGISGKRRDKELFYQYSSFLTPGKIHRHDFTSMECTLFRETSVPGLRADAFETKQVFYTSKDNTRIPMFIISKKGLELNGNNVTLLYGYGGFNVSVTPSFSVTWLVR